MKPGFKPRDIGQIFAPVPAARSRCLAAFIAIARQSLPLPLRYEPSHLLFFSGVILLIFGFFTDSLTRFGGMMITVGWGAIAFAGFALISQDRISFGRSRSRLIRQLDEVRRSVGLDKVILPESLEFLEATAHQWERIEHALAAQVWREQDPLRTRIGEAAQRTMEDLVVMECGSTAESGVADDVASETLTEAAAALSKLADQVDAVSTALTTYPRDTFDSNGESAEGVLPEMEDLEAILASLRA